MDGVPADFSKIDRKGPELAAELYTERNRQVVWQQRCEPERAVINPLAPGSDN
jgi:hypothetical protein